MSDFNPFSLTSKTILVTGASSGIGRAVAIACSKMGARLVLLGRNKQKLETTLGLLAGDGHMTLVADLTERDTFVRMTDTLPALDGIVHCAGIGQRALCKQLTEQDVDGVMDTNFKGPILLQQTLLEQKKVNKGGSIVFLSSIAANSPSIGHAVYSASKGAIISYAKCLSLELAPRNGSIASVFLHRER